MSSHYVVQTDTLPVLPAMTEEEEEGQSSLRTLSAVLFVPFWQPHLNIRARSFAVFKHVSNAALSQKDRQRSSSTSPNAHKVIFDLQM